MEDLNKNQENSSEEGFIKIFLIILIILVLLALISFIGYSIITRFQNNQTPDENPNNEGLSELEIRLKTCLQEDSFDNECALEFAQPSINNFCKKLSGSLKDKCYYTSALSNGDSSTCEKINDEELNNNCISAMLV